MASTCRIVIFYGNFSQNASLYRIFLRIFIDYSTFAHEISKSVHTLFRHIAAVLVALYVAIPLVAAEPAATVGLPAEEQTEAGPDEDFVTASVVVASPGTILYCALGHACLRLQCPDHGLDFIFSAEAEDAAHNVAQFFAGRLGMGVRAVPTADYLQQYSEEGRAVDEYRLNLPIAVKQRLWQQMDERLNAPDEPYDYMNSGCAVSVMHWIEDAIDADSLAFAPWPETFERSRKEFGGDGIASPWVHFLLFTIGEGEAYDTDVREPDKCIVPNDLVAVLQQATAYGRPLLDKKPHQLLPQTKVITYSWFTPLVFALIILLLAVVGVVFRVVRPILWTLYALAGAFITYLWLLSDLPCTQWSVLIVPFNVLPILGWRWRRFWAWPFAAVIILWCAVVSLWPHTLVEPAHIVLALAVAVMSVASRKKITQTIK